MPKRHNPLPNNSVVKRLGKHATIGLSPAAARRLHIMPFVEHGEKAMARRERRLRKLNQANAEAEQS